MSEFQSPFYMKRNRSGMFTMSDANGQVVLGVPRTFDACIEMFEDHTGFDRAEVIDHDGRSLRASRFDINKRFEFLEQTTTMVAEGEVSSVIITGNAGIGKTHTVFEVLDDQLKLQDGVHYYVIKGHSSNMALYRAMYDYRNKIIVFDDCDSIFTGNNATASNLLKAGLDTHKRQRIVSWRTEMRGNDDLPQEFEFEGQIIFISNLQRKSLDQAVVSRSFFVDVTMNTTEKLDRIEFLSVKLCDGDEAKAKACFELLKDVVARYQCGEIITIRTFLRIITIHDSEHVRDWREFAEYTIVNQ